MLGPEGTCNWTGGNNADITVKEKPVIKFMVVSDLPENGAVGQTEQDLKLVPVPKPTDIGVYSIPESVVVFQAVHVDSPYTTAEAQAV